MSSHPRGRTMPLSLPRRLVGDLLHFAAGVPSVPVQRRMRLRTIAEAREVAAPPVGWVALFTKAYARVCAETPPLRRAYLKFPTPHLYEHPENVASVAVERDFGDEPGVLFTKLRGPENQPLRELAGHLRYAKTAPLKSVSSFREAMRFTSLPRPLRRAMWWWGLNGDGRRRAKRFGTFGVSAYGSLGADSLHPVSPLTSLLNFGPVSPRGRADVRIVYDHRVLDGATVARSLARLEEILHDEIVPELREMAAAGGDDDRPPEQEATHARS